MAFQEQRQQGKAGIVDDFMYGSNVAASDIYIRLGFLRKVYGILSAQLIFTTIIASVFMFVEPVQNFAQQSPTLMLVTMFGSIGSLIALMFKSREVPTNYILLTVFTFFESLLIGTVVTFYKVHSVIEAFVLTAAVTTALTLYTMQSKRDFSSWGAGLFAVLFVLIIAGFMQLFLQSEMVDFAIAAGGSILFSLFIVYDTSLIMNKVTAEEYIHASISLYLDILNLFLHILRLLGERK